MKSGKLRTLARAATQVFVAVVLIYGVLTEAGAWTAFAVGLLYVRSELLGGFLSDARAALEDANRALDDARRACSDWSDATTELQSRAAEVERLGNRIVKGLDEIGVPREREH